MEEFVANTIQSELFKIEASISDDAIIQVEKIVPRAAIGEIAAPFRAKSYISIGEPLVFPLTRLDESTSSDIRSQLSHYEFFSVHLACSFEHAHSCRFFNARFSIDMHTVSAAPNDPSVPLQQAIAYDLYPQKIEDDRKISRRYSFNPELKFSFGPLTASLPLPHEQSEEYIAYHSRITASGLRTSKSAWHFERTDAHEIEGIQELFMLIRKPKSSRVNAIFSLAAQLEVMTKMGPFGPFPLIFSRRGSTDPLITDEPSIYLC